MQFWQFWIFHSLSDLWRGKGIEWEEIGKENKVDICYLLLLSLS